MESDSTVIIHGETLSRAELLPKIEQCRRVKWRPMQWAPRDALMQRAGGCMVMPYYGQAYDSADFEVVRRGWKRNLCEICYWELCESNELSHSTGYTDGRKWLCIECYDLFIAAGKK